MKLHQHRLSFCIHELEQISHDCWESVPLFLPAHLNSSIGGPLWHGVAAAGGLGLRVPASDRSDRRLPPADALGAPSSGLCWGWGQLLLPPPQLGFWIACGVAVVFAVAYFYSNKVELMK